MDTNQRGLSRDNLFVRALNPGPKILVRVRRVAPEQGDFPRLGDTVDDLPIPHAIVL